MIRRNFLKLSLIGLISFPVLANYNYGGYAKTLELPLEISVPKRGGVAGDIFIRLDDDSVWIHNGSGWIQSNNKLKILEVDLQSARK